MNSSEQKVKVLVDRINELSTNLDEDYENLSGGNIPNELLDTILSDALIAEIESMVMLFEVSNPDIFITGIQRLEDENGEAIVDLDWEYVGDIDDL